jgi:hypothetical protein
MGTAQDVVKHARLLHLVFLATVVLYAFAGEYIKPSEVAPEKLKWFRIGFAVVAAHNIFLAFRFRKRTISPALEMLAQDPENKAAQQKWHGGNVLTFCFCEVLCLLGFALRILGGSLLEASFFYAAAAALFLLWAPRAKFLRQN